MPIPKKIFQTWKSKEIQSPTVKRWADSWTLHNPNFEYVLWTDTENREFVLEHFPDLLSLYDSFTLNIKRVDLIRYLYLIKYGGVYADLDFECLQSFDDMINQANASGIEVILGQLGNMDNREYDLHRIPNALMIAKPESDFFKFVIKVLQNISPECEKTLDPEAHTGPIFLTMCVLFYLGDIDLTEPCLRIYRKNIFTGMETEMNSTLAITRTEAFYPINWNNKSTQIQPSEILTHEDAIKRFPDSLAVTYWMQSWSQEIKERNQKFEKDNVNVKGL